MDLCQGSLRGHFGNLFEWKGWGDFLGTGLIANIDRKFYTYIEASNLCAKKGLRARSEYHTFRLSDKKHGPFLHASPDTFYKGEWRTWGSFLQTGRIAVFNRAFLPFDECVNFVRSKNFLEKKDF